MKLEGLVAFITGGTSGLGVETAKHFIEKGAKVAITGRNKERGLEIANELGPNAIFIKMDVSKEEEVKSAIDEWVNQFGALHVAINSAGVLPACITITSKSIMDFDMLRAATEINLYGTIYVSAYAAKVMCKNQALNDRGEKGVIINVSSVAGFEGQRGQVPYSATKAAIIGITTPMARDLGRYGIRVVTLAPSLFETPMTESVRKNDKIKDSFTKDTPLNRLGKPDEFAHLAVSTVENSYLNGVTIRLDGATVLSHI